MLPAPAGSAENDNWFIYPGTPSEVELSGYVPFSLEVVRTDGEGLMGWGFGGWSFSVSPIGAAPTTVRASGLGVVDVEMDPGVDFPGFTIWGRFGVTGWPADEPFAVAFMMTGYRIADVSFGDPVWTSGDTQTTSRTGSGATAIPLECQVSGPR